MSKSYLGTLSLITSFLIAFCAVFIIPAAVSELGFCSIKVFFAEFLSKIGEFNVLVFTAFSGILIFNILLKCLNVAICKKLCNALVFLFDIAFIACSVLVLLFCASELFLFVLMLSVLAVVFDFIFFYAEM